VGHDLSYEATLISKTGAEIEERGNILAGRWETAKRASQKHVWPTEKSDVKLHLRLSSN